MIEVKDLSFSYSKRSRLILDKVNLSINPGEIVTLIGKNGSGKSTLFSLICGHRKYHQGSIKIDGVELSSMPSKERAKQIAFVPQLSQIESLTVYDTVMLGRLPYYLFAPSQKDKEVVEKILTELGLSSIAFSSINEISGGERQKAIIAMSLAQESKYIILDEPTNNLDITAEYDLFEILRNLAKSMQISVLFSTHDIELGYRYCDKFLLLDENGTLSSLPKEELKSEELSSVFGKDLSIIKYKDDIIIDYGRKQ